MGCPRWVEAKTGEGETYYYHAETRETRWTAPTEAEERLARLGELVAALSTKRDRVEAVAEWYAAAPAEESARQLCEALEPASQEGDAVSLMKRQLAALYVLDCVLRKKPHGVFVADAAGDLPSKLLAAMAAVFDRDSENERERLRAREAANSAVFVVGIWLTKRCWDQKILSQLQRAAAPLKWVETPPPPPQNTVPKPGSTVTGTVCSVRDFGCFVAVHGFSVNGLVPKHKQRQPLKLNDTVRLVVQPHKEKNKWAGACVSPDPLPTGRVVNVLPYGYFVRLDDGRDGLLHKNDARNRVFKKHDKLAVKVEGLNQERRCRFVYPDEADPVVVDVRPEPASSAASSSKTLRKINWSQRAADKKHPSPAKKRKPVSEPFEVKSFDEIIAEKKMRLKETNSA